ncbi:MAG: DUF934 domain-containing protein [Pseudomonadota bacterium]
MPLIKDGQEFNDDTLSHSLSEFLEKAQEILSENTRFGVRLSPDEDPVRLSPYLDRVARIEIDFPKYTDGRGFSQAQLLRRRLGYEGELRAVGHVLRDQLLYMHRSGFDAYATSRADLPSFLEAMREFSSFYQPAADGVQGVFAARHGR